jgi:regulator of sigma E protease
MLVLAEPATVVERIYNPFTLIWKGTERMVTFTWRNFVSIGKMFTGNVSVGTLGGPILIGKIAGESLSHGLVTFLTTMAILSIGLGVLNLLPVPILDGGHIVLLWIESARGKPLSMRQMEIIQGVGLVLILALMGVVMKNDITRLISL